MYALRVMTAVVTLLGVSAVGSTVPTSASSNELLYVQTQTDGLQVIKVYDASDLTAAPTQTLKGISAMSTGMMADDAGNLYVSQSDINQPAVIFKPGHTLPSTVLTNPSWPASEFHSSIPMDIAVGADKSVYVAIGGTPSGILVYAPGKTTPKKFLQFASPVGSPWCSATGISVDAKNDVYMSCNGYVTATAVGSAQTGRVIEFRNASAPGIDMGITVAAVVRESALGFNGFSKDIQVDAKGNILVLLQSPGQVNAVFVYPRGGNARRPNRVIDLGSRAASAADYTSTSLRLDATNTHLFVLSGSGAVSGGSKIAEYTYPGGKLVATFMGTPSYAFAVSPSSVGR
jgi:hypothetical protein